MIAEKRLRIIDAAMKLFNEFGYHGTPTSKIAKRARVSVGTLFNYFATKEELIEAIYIHIKLHSKMSFLEHLEPQDTEIDSLFSMWRAIIMWGVENPEEFKYLELFCHSPFRSTYRTEKSLEAYKVFQEEILKKVTPDTVCDNYPDYVLRYIDNALHAATRFLLQNDIDDVEPFIRSAFEMLWNGLAHR